MRLALGAALALALVTAGCESTKNPYDPDKPLDKMSKRGVVRLLHVLSHQSEHHRSDARQRDEADAQPWLSGLRLTTGTPQHRGTLIRPRVTSGAHLVLIDDETALNPSSKARGHAIS